jgi:hypothetical protein
MRTARAGFGGAGRVKTERSLKMRRATMATSDLSNFYRPKKGKYRRRTDVPIAKPVKGKYRK